MTNNDDQKYNDVVESGTWIIKSSTLATVINSNNARKVLVSPLIFNAASKIAARIQLQASPTNNGQVSLTFTLCSNSNMILQIQCNSPYFSKMESTSSSVNHTIDKSSLLSPTNIPIQYTIKPKLGNKCFSFPSSPQSHHSYNSYSSNYSPNCLSPNSKPIPFVFTFNSSILTELSTKVNYHSNNQGVYRIKSIYDKETNTTWCLYLVCDKSQQNYSLQIQPTNTKPDQIQAWFELECPTILYYSASASTCTRNHPQYHLSPHTIGSFQRAMLSNEKVLHFKGHIFAMSWKMKTFQGGNNMVYIDITSDLYGSGSSQNVNDTKGIDELMKKMNTMSLQIQTLSSGLNNMLRSNQELKNKVSKLEVAVNNISNHQNNDENKQNDGNNVVFDPVY
eukprot:289743_1